MSHMKNSCLVALSLLTFNTIWSQKVKPTNTYPSNLEENQYFEGYDATTQTIKGIHFMVLSDGNNSLDRTPEFVVKLYLYQEGKEPIFIKTYELETGIAHMSAREFKNEKVNLKEFNIEPGIYRLGLYINADKSFVEDMNDNAMLFRDPINIKKSSQNEPGGIYQMTKPQNPPKKTDDDQDEQPEDDQDDK